MPSSNSRATCGFLFDLDGTLLDSAPEYVRALNTLLRDDHLPTVEFSHARNFVSRGAYSLLRLGYGHDLSDDHYANLRPRFLEEYERLAGQSSLFDGIAPMLDELEIQQIPWGIVTNKPAFLTEQVVPTILKRWPVRVTVSGDSLPVAKPHPDPVFHACAALEIDPAASVFVGDAEVDVVAGNAAGLRTAIAEWGYFPPDTQLAGWNADTILDVPAKIPGLVSPAN